MLVLRAHRGEVTLERVDPAVSLAQRVERVRVRAPELVELGPERFVLGHAGAAQCSRRLRGTWSS